MHLWWGPNLTLLYNDAYVSFLGRGKHPAALGRSGREAWSEVWDTIGPMVNRVFACGGASWSEDILMFFDRHLPREEVYVTFSFSPVHGLDSSVDGMFCACTETTEKLVGNRRLHALRELCGRTADARSATEAIETAARVLGENAHDVPFAGLYLVDEIDGRARRAAWTGPEGRPCPLPTSAAPTDDDTLSPWPLARVLRTKAAADSADLGELPMLLPGGPWPEPAHRAVVLPIRAATHGTLAGLLVAGVSPRRPLDGAYRTFLDLVAGQIGKALADARASAEERRRAEALAEIDRAKTSFFSNLSHELRTPLALILGPIEDMLRARRLPAEGRGSVEVVHRNALRLLKLVDSLLDFSKIEAGQARAVRAPIDLARLTAELAGVFRSTIERGGLRLVVDCPPLPAEVCVDREMWEKIVLNLLSNAFKFTFEGEIEVALRTAGDELALTVRDTGTGIPADELSRVFERFHRVPGARSRTHEGAGVGLALVSELAKLHGGRVDVESAPDAGSTFRVVLPFARARRTEPHASPAESLAPDAICAAPYVEEARHWLAVDGDDPRSVREPPSALGARILLADENADMCAYVKRLLGERWTVEAVGDGVTALAAARATMPDLVVTDVMTSGVNGFDLLHELRADPRTASIPVIVLSARAGEEAKVAGLANGADDYLVKPFSAKELVARASAHITLARARAAAAERLQFLAEASRELGRSIDYETTVQIVARVAVPMLGNLCCFDLADAGGTTVRAAVAYADGEAPAWLDRARTIAPPIDAPGSPLARVLRTGEPMIEPAVDDDWLRRVAAPHPHLAFLREAACRSMLVVPVPGRDRLLGALSLHFTGDDARRHTIDDLRLAEELGRRAAIALENALLHRETETARAQAEEASRAKDEFLAMLGHELRNPLGAISSASQILGDGAAPQSARAREIIRRQVTQLARLVDDLLDAGRVALGKISLDRKPIDVAATALRLVHTLCAAETPRHDLRLDLQSVWIDADDARIEQLLGNLLGNALKFTPRGGAITVRVRPDGADAILSVEDSGAGIAPEALPRIFDLFYQSDATIERAQGGLGIGLTLVKRVAELHGGTVCAASDGRGLGTTFTVRLPRIQEPSRVPEREMPHEEVPARRILVVEDNDDARETLIDLLALEGNEVQGASDGPGGIEAALRLVPDVAFIDIGLPGVDGYEVARQIRRSPVCPGMKLVALTGYGQPEDKQRAFKAGFDAHLVKPVSFEQLEDMLRQTPPAERS